MTDITRIRVVSTAETALKKLKKYKIPVYDCRKDGLDFIFGVKDKHLKKVFAIFSDTCYNIRVASSSGRARLLKRAVTRAGLIVGAFIFVLAAAVSDSFVFRISVSGSGAYLSPEVRRIIYESGAKEFSACTRFDAPAAIGKILALPQVTFCNIEKRGSVLKVDVRVDEEHGNSVTASPLVSDRDGTVKNIVAVCGTARFAAGDRVKKGDVLISDTVTVGEEEQKSLAAGYAELECRGRAEYFAESESDENLKAAYSSVLLEADRVLSRSHTVKQTDGGVVYVIEFTYLHKLSINIK